MGRAHELQVFIDAGLMTRGITPLDGWAQPTCQTGETYIEVTLGAVDMEILKTALLGAVSVFGVAGDKCYWRIRPDLEDHETRLRAYARFRISNKPELPKTEAA